MRDNRGPPLEPTPDELQRIKQKQQRKRRRERGRLEAKGRRAAQTYNHVLDSTLEHSSSEENEEDIEQSKLVRPADPKLHALTRSFFNTFQGLNVEESVCGLNVAGMIDHKEGEHKGHYSILYTLPGKIGVQTRDRPAEHLMLRAPVTLQSLLGQKREKGIRSTLGARFDLARKLVRAVCLLLSSGWLHKNIRADSVIFFPEHVNTLQEDRYESSIEIDVSKPILMGYIFSRPDDVITRMDLAATSQELRPDITARHTEHTNLWIEGPKPGHPRFDSIYGRDMLRKNDVPEQPTETYLSGFKLDYYQHPAKHANPKRLYRHAYDLYSLGIVLLEVGPWRGLRNYDAGGSSVEDHYDRRRWICRQFIDELRWECGETYADVVLSCLMIGSSDDEVGKAEREGTLCENLG
ncbi:hypothetical protein LTR84_008881 [Exophiala bonariae]|uniref:Protein kinase domain-containing protein n=1 Tax=Exophiala bonariae TaxID=1690606 RepID=A0AAV9MZH6_9EURO|nr:hypothetical protein LTR84_008881 [Exophiala bonariae]